MMNDLDFLKLAFKEAKKAYVKDKVPVGTLIVINGEIIAKAHNKKESLKDQTLHAEIEVIKKACKVLGRKILDDATIYITLEPCLMCAGAILNARIKKIVYGAKAPKFGVLTSLGNVFEDFKFNHELEVVGPLMEDEVSEIMKSFFKNKR